MNEEIEILFYYDIVDESTFAPMCLIFFNYENKLHHSKLKISATSLSDSGYYSISSYLEDRFDDLIDEIMIDDRIPTTIKDIEIISDSNPEYSQMKSNLKRILRKQKIENILN